MQKWNRFLLITLLILGLIPLSMGAFTPTRLSEATIAAQYPDADVLIIDDLTQIKYEADGTYHYQGEIVYQILTEKGRQKKSSVNLGYDAAYGSLSFLRADLIKSDETVVPIDLEQQVRESISAGQMNANIYDPNHKSIQLSVPDLEIGDLLRYSYKGNRSKTVVPNSWSDWFVFEESDPILHATYEVNAPSALPLKNIRLRDEIPNTVQSSKQSQGDRILYQWEISRVPRMFTEPQMPSPHTVNQRLLLSTLSDWESLSTWYWELSKPQLEKTTPAMKTKVEELTEGLTDRQKKIEAIFRFVSQDIRYMGITVEDEAPGYEPHDVSLTFENRYGVCRDKAALLAAMLRLGGFDAYPVLIYVGPKKDPEVPQPWFNHAITAVRHEDGTYQLMDSTDENTRDLLPAYLSDCSYLVAHPDGETLQTSPIISPEENMLTIEVDATLEKQNRIHAEAVLSFNGINDTAYRGRLARLQPDQRHPYFEERLKQALGNATLSALQIMPEDVRDTTTPLSVRLRFTIDNAVASGAEESLIRMPTLINHFGLFGSLIGRGIGLNQRRYPLKTRMTCGIEETVRLDLSPCDLRPSVLPTFEKIDSPQLLIHREVETTNDLLTSRATLHLRTVEFSPHEYLDLKTNLKQSEKNARKQVVLHPGGFPSDANFATLEETIEYSVFSPNHWKKEHTLHQKVLTYAGKKELSDYKVRYNPSFENVIVNDAHVIAPDGSVQYIDPDKEVNRMDAKWNGDAPRYSGEKILVINLPRVEVGSTIHIKTTTLYAKRPFFSAQEYFGGNNPIVKKTVRLITPHQLDIQLRNTSPKDVRHRTYHDGEQVVREWIVEHRSMVKKEDHAAPKWVQFPSVLFSTGSPEAYAKTLNEALQQAAKPDKTMKEKVKRLTHGIKDPLEKATLLRNHVDRNIRLAGPGLPELPLTAITPATRTLTEGYGNHTDRAVVLYALCKLAKLNPRFVLSSNLPELEALSEPATEILQQRFFDTLLVAVEVDKDHFFYFGDSGRYSEPGTLRHARRPALDIEKGFLETPLTSITNSTETVIHIDLAESGHVDLYQKTTYRGTAFEQFHKKFAEFTPEERTRAYQTLLSSLSQSAEAAGDLRTDFTYPGVSEFAARIDDYAVRDGEHLYLSLPGGLGDLLQLKTTERDSSFYIASPVTRTIQYEIKLPEGWTVSMAPESFMTHLPNGGGTVEFITGTIGNKLMMIQRANLQPALISPKEYNQLVDLNNQLTQPAAHTLLLKKK